MGCKSPTPRKRAFKSYVFIVFQVLSSSIETEKVELGSTMYNTRARITKNGVDLWIDNANLDRQILTYGIVFQDWIDNQDRHSTRHDIRNSVAATCKEH